jgi:hypothetical protein
MISPPRSTSTVPRPRRNASHRSAGEAECASATGRSRAAWKLVADLTQRSEHPGFQGWRRTAVPSTMRRASSPPFPHRRRRRDRSGGPAGNICVRFVLLRGSALRNASGRSIGEHACVERARGGVCHCRRGEQHHAQCGRRSICRQVDRKGVLRGAQHRSASSLLAPESTAESRPTRGRCTRPGGRAPDSRRHRTRVEADEHGHAISRRRPESDLRRQRHSDRRSRDLRRMTSHAASASCS